MKCGMMKMSRLTIFKENPSDCVRISTQFIDQYLAGANDAQIKVYLYLLRMVSASLPTSISDIADKFNLTERDVERALAYWEKFGLLEIEYDKKGEICALQLPSDKEAASKVQSQSQIQPGATILPLPVKEAPAKQEPEKPQKREFSRDELKALKQQESFSQLLFATETYFKRPLTSADLQKFAFIHEELSFSEELMEYLVEYCVGADHKDMRYIEKVAIAWHQAGIKTVTQAKNRSSRYEKIVYNVMQALGRRSDVTQTEADYILKWYHEYGFSENVILHACEKAVLSTEKNRITYTDGILKNWHAQGLKTISQIQKAEEKRAQSMQPSKNLAGEKGALGMVHNQYIRRDDTDIEALEKELLKYK